MKTGAKADDLRRSCLTAGDQYARAECPEQPMTIPHPCASEFGVRSASRWSSVWSSGASICSS